MEYYDIFGLDRVLAIDEVDLKKRFYENSRKFHPDHFTLASPEKQEEQLQLSSVNNQAYQVLGDLQSRIQYVLTSHHKIEEGGKSATMPQEFLMEMMDFNDRIMEATLGDPAESEKLYQDLDALIKELHSSLDPIMNTSFDQYQDRDWELVITYYQKVQYIRRLIAQLKEST